MAKLIALTAGALLVVILAAAGIWSLAADRGWIAGKPNSPRAENFKRALDDYLGRAPEYSHRACVPLAVAAQRRQAGFAETAFDWTPAGFLARPSEQDSPAGPARLRVLERHGLLASRQAPDGTTEYVMTWKGYAASIGGCFNAVSPEREAKIIAFEKARTDNGVDVYHVVARPMPRSVEPWVTEPEFKDLVPPYVRQAIEPEPVTYEAARSDNGFTILGERNKQTRARPGGGEAAIMAKMAGHITPERVKTALDAYLQGAPLARMTIACLELPVNGEADEHTGSLMSPMPDQPRAPLTFTIYNLPDRRDAALQSALRAFEMLRRLESLGMAKSEQIAATSFRGQGATGAVRFEIATEVLGRLPRGNARCLPVGTFVPDEVISVQQFTESQPRPRYIARARLQPDAAAKVLLDKFPHLGRMIEPGVPVQGTLRFHDGRVMVESASAMPPRPMLEVAAVSLPVVEAPSPARQKQLMASVPVATPTPFGDIVFQSRPGRARISNEGLTMNHCCAGAFSGAAPTRAHLSGKWYAEFTLHVRPGATNPDGWTNVGIATGSDIGSELQVATRRGGASVIPHGAWTRYRDGDVFAVALDADNGRAYFAVNGNWLAGAPGSAEGALLPRGAPLVAMVTASASSRSAGTDSWTANFGKTKFRYSIPRGYLSYDGRQAGK